MNWMNGSTVIVVGCGVSEVNIMENDVDVLFCERDFSKGRVYEWASIKEYKNSNCVIDHW